MPSTTRLAPIFASLALVLLAPGCGKKPDKNLEKKATPAAAAPAAEPEAAAEPDVAADREEPDAGAPDAGHQESVKDRRETPPDVAAPPASAKKTASGIAWRLIKAGEGALRPERDDVLWVNYSTWTPDGTLKGTSFKLKGAQPRELRFAKAIPGWREMLQEMAVGERRMVWIPKKLAYPNRPPKKATDRVVDLELVKLKKAPKAPADVKKPPKDATRTASGLAWKELKAGTGTAHPSPTSMVTVRYAGWTTDGVCFDSTGDDETMSFMVNGVIEGWVEGLQLMVPGQKVRMWIPKKIAYDGMDGKPQGQLTFDVELISIDSAPK